MSVELNYTTAKVRNADGEYENMPSLKGESVYDMAVRLGYVGSEEQFVEDLLSDGWVNSYQKLDNNKANKTDLKNYCLKSEVPTAATKALYGLSSDASLHDVFAKIHRPIGTIEYSIRTDLGSKWLLCNGSAFSPTKYPDLAALRSFNAQGLMHDHSSHVNTFDGTSPSAMLNAGGYWVFITAESSRYYVHYTTDLITWTKKSITTVNLSTGSPRSLDYVNGEFIFICHEQTSATGLVMYRASKPSGTWTKKVIDSSIGKNLYIGGIAHDGTNYVLNVSDTDNNVGYIYHATSLTASFTKTQVKVGNITYNRQFGHIRYLNGNFVFSALTRKEGSDGSTTSSYAIYYFTSPTGTINVTETGVLEVLKDITYLNGQYIGVANKSVEDESVPILRYTTDLSKTWTASSATMAGYVWVNRIVLVNGKFYFVFVADKKAYVACGTSGTSFTYESVLTLDDTASSSFCSAIGEDAVLHSCGDEKLYANIKNILPEITPDKSYAYIKALE